MNTLGCVRKGRKNRKFAMVVTPLSNVGLDIHFMCEEVARGLEEWLAFKWWSRG